MIVVARRELLVGSSMLLAGMATQALHAQIAPKTPIPPQPEVAPVNAPSTITIADRNEPGDRLVVTGRVFAADGKTPIRGVSIYAYHTDAKGIYNPAIDSRPDRNPRLYGYMRTDARGRYEFATIRPGPYPNDTIPAHIHYVVSMPGYRTLHPEVLFSGDPLISDMYRTEVAKPRGRFSIPDLTKDAQGAWHITQDFFLRPLVDGGNVLAR